jgi:hypothetical protein
MQSTALSSEAWVGRRLRERHFLGVVRHRLNAGVATRKRKIFQTIRRIRGGAAFLGLAHRTLESLAAKYISRRLSELPNLEGGIEAIDIGLLRGRVVLRGLHLVKYAEGRRVLEGNCEEISVQIQWRDLLQGVLVGRVKAKKPFVQVYASVSEKGDSSGETPKEALLALCRETRRFMPFHLQSFEVMGGEVEYISQHTHPPYKLQLADLSVSAVNLTNMTAPKGSASHILAEAWTTGHGRFWMRLKLPAVTDALTFDLQAGVNDMNLVDLNDALRAIAKFDLKRGVCTISSEFKVENGHYEGQVQPHFHNLDLFAWQKDHGKSFLQICRQAVIAFLAGLFKNRPRDELALNIKVSGTFEDADVDIWAAVGSLLRNAFARSFFGPEPTPEPHVRPQSAFRGRKKSAVPA